jgi:hypothetical protein
MQTLIWRRRLKYSSGTVGVMMTSYGCMFIMMFLCVYLKSTVTGDAEATEIEGGFLVPRRLRFPAYPAQPEMGWPMIGQYIPSADMVGSAKVTFGFYPCTPKVNEFMELFKTTNSMGSSASWDITCFEQDSDLDKDVLGDYYKKNPTVMRDPAWVAYYANASATEDDQPDFADESVYNLGGIVFSAQSALLLDDLSVPVEYTQRHNASLLPAAYVESPYGGSHNTDVNNFMYVISWQLQLQAYFEDVLVAFRSKTPDDENEAANIGNRVHANTNVVRSSTWDHYFYSGSDGTYMDMAPMFHVMILSSIVCELLQDVLSEKENKFKMNLAIAGLPDWAYWATWWKQMMTTMLGLVVVLTIIDGLYVFSATSIVVIFIFFLASAMAFISVTLTISSCLVSAAVGSLVGESARRSRRSASS